MKRLIEDTSDSGLESLLGENVTLYCANYIYAGKLVGVNDSCVELADPHIVYNTGAHDSATWDDAERFPGPWFVRTQAIESFGVFK